MKTELTSVLNGRLPEIRTIEPNSPRARPSASPAPEMIAGASDGRITRLNVVRPPAPSDAAASSASLSRSISTGCTERTTGGSALSTQPARRAQRGSGGLRRWHYLAVETPIDFSIFATMPLSGSKNLSFTVDQPPSLSIVNRSFGVGNLDLSTSELSIGR